MNARKKLVLIVTILLVFVLSLITYQLIDRARAWRLFGKYSSIRVGMKIERVVQILGPPQHRHVVDPQQILPAWEFDDSVNIKRLRTEYPQLGVYEYQLKQASVLARDFHPPIGITVYFDEATGIVVLVHHHIENWLKSERANTGA